MKRWIRFKMHVGKNASKNQIQLFSTDNPSYSSISMQSLHWKTPVSVSCCRQMKTHRLSCSAHKASRIPEDNYWSVNMCTPKRFGWSSQSHFGCLWKMCPPTHPVNIQDKQISIFLFMAVHQGHINPVYTETIDGMVQRLKEHPLPNVQAQ